MKRGMSQIITTVIIIGIALAAIGIVWYVINTVVNEQVSSVENESSKVFQSCSDAGYYKIVGSDGCIGSVKYLGGEKCCDGVLNSLYGLVSYWSFDVDARDDWEGNNGTVNGATWDATGGHNGKGAYEFDGVNDYISIPHNDNQNVGNNLTITSWIKYEPHSSTYEFILGKGLAYNGLGIQSNNRLMFFTAGGGGDNLAQSETFAFTKNGWYHTAVSFDNSTLNTTFYKNGVLLTTTNSPETGISSSTSAMKIGAYPDAALYYFNGTIDEVRIYNRALSAEEVKALYELG